MVGLRLVRRGMTRFRGAADDLVRSVRNFEFASIPARVGGLVLVPLGVGGGGVVATLVGLAVMYFAYGWAQNVLL